MPTTAPKKKKKRGAAFEDGPELQGVEDLVLEPTVGRVDRERVKVARENAALADVDQLPGNILAFDQYKAAFKVPFTLYADFECYVTEDRKHVPSGYCLYTVSDYEVTEPKVYSGENVMDTFFRHICDERDRIA